MPLLLTPDGKRIDESDVYRATDLVKQGQYGVASDGVYDMITPDGVVTSVKGSELPDALAEKYRFASKSDIEDYDARKADKEGKEAADYLKATGVDTEGFGGGLGGAASAFATGAGQGLLTKAGGDWYSKHFGRAGEDEDAATKRIEAQEKAHPYITGAGNVAGFLAGGELLRAGSALARGGAAAGRFGAEAAGTLLEGLGKATTAGVTEAAGDLGAAAGRALARGTRLAGREGLAARVASSALEGGGRLAGEGAAFGAMDLLDEPVRMTREQTDQAERAFAQDNFGTAKAYIEHAAGSVMRDAAVNVVLGGALHGLVRTPGAVNEGYSAFKRPGDSALGAVLEHYAGVPRSGVGKEVAKEFRESVENHGLESSPKELARIEKDARAVEKRVPGEDVGPFMREVGPANRTLEAERRRELLGVTEGAKMDADRAAAAIAKDFNDLRDVSRELTTSNRGEAKRAHMERLVQDHDAYGPLATATGLLHASQERMAQMEKDHAVYGIGAQARRILGVQDAAAQEILAGMQTYMPEALAAAEKRLGLKPAKFKGNFHATAFGVEPAEGAIKFSPEGDTTQAVSRLNKIMAVLPGVSPPDAAATRKMNGIVLNTMDGVKRIVGELAQFDKRTTPPATQMGLQTVRQIYGALARALESAETWGEKAALAQKETNAATTMRIRAEESSLGGLIKRDSTGKRVMDQKALASALRTLSTSSDPLVAQNLRDEIMAHAHEMDAFAKHFYDETGPKSVGADIGAKLVKDFDEAVKQQGRHRTFAKIQAETTKNTGKIASMLGLGSGLPSLVVDHALGVATGIGMVPSMVLMNGLAAPALRRQLRPAEQIYDMARRAHAAKEMDIEVKSAIAKKLGLAKTIENMRTARQSRDSVEMARKNMAASLEKMGKQYVKENESTLDGLGEATARQALRLKFLGAAHAVQAFKQDPDRANMAMLKAWSGGEDDMPESAHEFASTMETAMNYLDSVRPKPAQPSPFALPALDTGVSVGDMQKFVQTASAVFDPRTVLGAFDDGTITKEQAEALKTVYPSIFESAKQQIVEGMGELKGRVPYNTQVALSTLFDVPVSSTMKPDFIARMQAAYMSDDQPDPSNDGNGPGRGRPRGPAPKLASQMMTGAQSIEARAST